MDFTHFIMIQFHVKHMVLLLTPLITKFTPWQFHKLSKINVYYGFFNVFLATKHIVLSRQSKLSFLTITKSKFLLPSKNSYLDSSCKTNNKTNQTRPLNNLTNPLNFDYTF